jgi:hypothetical protein
MTKVAFKIEVNPHTEERGVFAFFPMEKDRHNGEEYTSYSHNGQHTLCAKSYFDRRRWANFHEYVDLYQEMVRIGYKNLKVLNKDWDKMKSFAVEDDFGHRVNGIEAKFS